MQPGDGKFKKLITLPREIDFIVGGRSVNKFNLRSGLARAHRCGLNGRLEKALIRLRHLEDNLRIARRKATEPRKESFGHFFGPWFPTSLKMFRLQELCDTLPMTVNTHLRPDITGRNGTFDVGQVRVVRCYVHRVNIFPWLRRLGNPYRRNHGYQKNDRHYRENELAARKPPGKLLECSVCDII